MTSARSQVEQDASTYFDQSEQIEALRRENESLRAQVEGLIAAEAGRLKAEEERDMFKRLAAQYRDQIARTATLVELDEPLWSINGTKAYIDSVVATMRNCDRYRAALERIAHDPDVSPYSSNPKNVATFIARAALDATEQETR